VCSERVGRQNALHILKRRIDLEGLSDRSNSSHVGIAQKVFCEVIAPQAAATSSNVRTDASLTV
jgi:hypothetical protein